MDFHNISKTSIIMSPFIWFCRVHDYQVKYDPERTALTRYLVIENKKNSFTNITIDLITTFQLFPRNKLRKLL